MRKRIAILLLLCLFTVMPSAGALADETALFTTVASDVLFLLDASGSMLQSPSGDPRAVYNPDSTCMADSWYSGRGFSGGPPFTDCRRFALAKRAMFNVMDDNRDAVVNSSDQSSLNVRVGWGVFQKTEGITAHVLKEIGTSYGTLFCGRSTCSGYDVGYTDSCSSPYNDYYTPYCYKAAGGTPLNDMLTNAKTYLDQNKAADSSQSCRQKFVVLVSDGEDTTDCYGNGGQDKKAFQRRRNSVLQAKTLADAGYKLFVVGMGADMPDYTKNTLNWMAYYGGTDNPMVSNSGNKAALNVSAFSPTACTGGVNVSEPLTGGDCDKNPPYGEGPDCFAATNDPGTLSLSGYAFLTRTADDLMAAMKQAMAQVREANYSFATASVASARLQDENYIYEASFTPMSADSMWVGHLKKYNVNADGTVGSVIWDAGSVLQSTAETARGIYTMKSGTWTAFTTDNISPANLGLGTTDTAGRNLVVGFIRGSSTYNIDNWKLGDIFRSAPVTVGTPTPGFADARDSANAFNSYRSANTRSSANGKRMILAGANDGQLHAFRTSDGFEAWSFIPPNLLPKLKSIAHNVHPTGLSHAYLVDGPISVADVWRGTGDGKTKAASDWKTLAIVGLGRGAGDNLWSSSENCDANFSNMYATLYDSGGNAIATADKYCGYHALDITDTLSPLYKFTIKPTAAQAPYLGEPWSRIYVGRVLSGGNERWVGFMGGGHNMANCPGGSDCDTRGKGFFVIGLFDDAATGNGKIFWSKTHADVSGMNYALPAPAALVDTDGDGFVDMAYIGDLVGNIWRFKFCTRAMGDSCTTANWSVGLFFDSAGSGGQPVYSVPAVARDAYNNHWVYWGTGDRVNPTARNTQDRFYAVKDSDLTSTRRIGDLENISSSTYADNATKKGWYVSLPGGEKVLAEATVFGGVAYFTSYTPAAANADTCSQAGTANLYGVDYVTGAGTLAGDARKTTLGVGIPTAPTVSLSPDGTRPDLYVTLSGGAGTSASTIRAPVSPPYVSNRTNILLWRDNRMQ